jgi:hypothetical protein
MGPDMGHQQPLSDGAAVQAIAETVFEVAAEYMFSGEAELLRELPDRRIRAKSFDAHFRLQADRPDWRSEHEQTMLVVLFAPAGKQIPEPWSLWIRVSDPERKDRLRDDSPFSSKWLRQGRNWRGKGPGLRRRRESPEEYRIPWGRHDNLWIVEAATPKARADQMADIAAQVALFLLQARLAEPEGPVRDHLIDYLRRFKWRGIPIDDRDADIYEVFEFLHRNKWWTDDWRAWRKLVRRCIDGEVKKHRGRDKGIDLQPDADGNLTVHQFCLATGVRHSTAYQWIKEGRMRSVRNGCGRKMIPSREVPRIKDIPKRRDLLELATQRGRSRAAARKWVYRQERAGKALTEIAEMLLRSPQAARTQRRA